MAKEPGDLILTEVFHTKKIQLYSNGYVQVSSILGIIDKGWVEKLYDIDGSADVSKKTGPGRAAGAIFTMGANLVYSPNTRGNAYLNIITDSQTHSIMKEAPSPSDIKALNKILATGKSLVSRIENKKNRSSSKSSGDKDLTRQLKDLEKLFKSGALTQKEYQQAKKKLLD